MTITLLIIILTALVSFSAFSNEKLMNDLIFYPPAVSKRNQWYRFFSCGLIHADIPHLVFNMLSLYLFGQIAEDKFVDIFGNKGKLLYLALYVSALLVCLLPTYFKNKDNFHYRSLGASGAVSAVVFAGLLMVPWIEVGFFIIPPFIPGFVFGPLYLIISYILDKRGRDNINHSAHYWGALYGVAFVLIAGKFIANYDAVQGFIRGIQYYLKLKGM